MKKLLLVCAIVFGISAFTYAQGRGGMNMKPEERASQLKTALNLTDEQTAKITAIYASQSRAMDSLRNAGGDMSAMRPFMASSTSKIRAVLTPEQAVKFDAMQSQRGNRGATPPSPPPHK